MKAIISTKLDDAYISVDGKEYKLIPKTIGTDKALIEIKDELSAEGKAVYECWHNTLRLLLGDEAVAELIPSLDDANPDYVERLFYGTLQAYNANSSAFKAEREKKKADEAMAVINRMAKPIKEMAPVMEAVNAKKGQSIDE